MDDRANAFAFMHQVKGSVDVFERHRVGDELVDFYFAIHILVNHSRQLRTALATTKGGTAPDSTGNKLKWARGYFLPGTRDTDDDRLTPSFVTTLQGRAHQLGIADTFEREINTTAGELDDDVLNGLVIIIGVDAIRGAKLSGKLEFVFIDVDRNDTTRVRDRGTLNGAQSDAAESKDGDRISRLDLGRIQYCPNAGRNAAAQQTNLFEWRVFADFGDRDFRQHGVFAEGRRTHIMINSFSS